MIGEIKSYIYLYALSFLIHILLSSHNNKDKKVQFAKVICKMYIDILFEIPTFISGIGIPNHTRSHCLEFHQCTLASKHGDQKVIRSLWATR